MIEFPPDSPAVFHALPGSALEVRYFTKRVQASEKLVKRLKRQFSEALIQHRVNVSILNDLKKQ